MKTIHGPKTVWSWRSGTGQSPRENPVTALKMMRDVRRITAVWLALAAVGITAACGSSKTVPSVSTGQSVTKAQAVAYADAVNLRESDVRELVGARPEPERHFERALRVIEKGGEREEGVDSVGAIAASARRPSPRNSTAEAWLGDRSRRTPQGSSIIRICDVQQDGRIPELRVRPNRPISRLSQARLRKQTPLGRRIRRSERHALSLHRCRGSILRLPLTAVPS